MAAQAPRDVLPATRMGGGVVECCPHGILRGSYCCSVAIILDGDWPEVRFNSFSWVSYRKLLGTKDGCFHTRIFFECIPWLNSLKLWDSESFEFTIVTDSFPMCASCEYWARILHSSRFTFSVDAAATCFKCLFQRSGIPEGPDGH
jgi:hypothetical protein